MLLLGWTLLVAITLSLIGALLFYKRRYQKVKKEYHHVIPAPDHYDIVTEIAIVGAGILGSSLAATLARDGRKVTLLERDLSEPDRIVGELLQPGGFRALKKLGLDDSLEGTDYHIVHGYVVHDNYSNTHVQLSYPINAEKQIETGRSFHHGRFVMGLRKQAKNETNVTVVEGTVCHLLEDNNGVINGVQYKDKENGLTKTVKADLTVVADGCFSKFRKDLVTPSVSVWSNFVGVIMHNVPQFAPGHAEIVLGNSGPILIYQISSTCTRILVDVPSKLPSNLKDYMVEKVAPQLPDYICGPFLKAVENDRLRSMPNSFLPPLPNLKPGVIILGDAFNMRHPLTGAGMSVALNDVLLLRQIFRNISHLTDHDQFQNAFNSFQIKRKCSHSFVINILAQALYALFASPEGHMNDLRQACFEYFKLGGLAVSGPVGLLSALKPYPSVLLGHFYVVAFFAIYRTSKKHLLSFRPDKALYKSMMIFISASRLILPLIFSEVKSFIYF